MRRLSIAALVAVPLLFITTAGKTAANPPQANGFGCGDFCLGLFKNIHQHGPLFNYGPYYGYYPFKPYGPWDAYLRYDPFFYGDPYRNWVPPNERVQQGQNADPGNQYGWNSTLSGLQRLGDGFGRAGFGSHRIGLPHWGHKHGCSSCGLAHASWLHGGWFRGHAWVHGGSFGHSHHKHGCSTCGGVTTVQSVPATGDVLTRYSGMGSVDQSGVFYSNTPALNPVLDLVPVAAESK